MGKILSTDGQSVPTPSPPVQLSLPVIVSAASDEWEVVRQIINLPRVEQ